MAKGTRELYLRIAIPLLAVFGILLGLQYYSKGDNLVINRLSTNASDNFIHITDSEEVAEHLRSLGLTPHHSIEFLSPQEVPDENGIFPYVKRTLHGRFLHITDMHPDELNVVGGAIRTECHKKLKKVTDEESISHEFGDALSGCDSPMGLYTETLKWVRENLKDHIDFVIWTGDNIRHDNDRENPRYESEIFDMNERVADDMAATFMDENEDGLVPIQRRVKVIPSLGNNDVYPHNLFAPGPTLQTREMFKIWRDFIPSEQMHTFDRGAYFLREVIPDKLVVLSINTLYWFTKNPLNDNCDSRKQPGYKLFLWLGATLRECRKRGLKVWLSGHVPPIPNNIHGTCYSKMGAWHHEYSDVIIGGMYGHMNIDHFVPLDGVKAWKSIRQKLAAMGHTLDYPENSWMNGFDWDEEESNEQLYYQLGLINERELLEFDKIPFTQRAKDSNEVDENEVTTLGDSDRYSGAPNGKVSYLEDTRDELYVSLKGKKKSGEHFERYGIAHISTSVIPTFNPGMRVWEYNVEDLLNSSSGGTSYYDYFTGLLSQRKEGSPSGYVGWSQFFKELEQELEKEDDNQRITDAIELKITRNEGNIDELQSALNLFYSMSKDKTIPKVKPPGTELGPGYVEQALSPQRYTQYFIDLDEVNYGSKLEPFTFEYKVQYSTDDELYDMESLLVSDWVKLGKRLSKSSSKDYAKGKKKNGKKKNKKADKLWDAFINRAFIGSNYEELEGSVK